MKKGSIIIFGKLWDKIGVYSDKIPVEQVLELIGKTYRLDGRTPLYDAKEMSLTNLKSFKADCKRTRQMFQREQNRRKRFSDRILSNPSSNTKLQDDFSKKINL